MNTNDSFAGFRLSRVADVPVLSRRDNSGKTFRATVLWQRPMGLLHAARALLPSLLQHGSAAYPDRPALARQKERLYGAGVGFSFSRHGERSVLRLSADAVSGACLPGAPDQFAHVAELMAEVSTRSRVLAGDVPAALFERERAQALADARSVTEDRARQARLAAVMLACAGEPYGVPEHGGEAAIAAMQPEDPRDALRDVLEQGVPVALLAGALPDDAEAKLAAFFAALPKRREGALPLPVQPARREVRSLRESAPMQQAKVVLVLRTPVPRSSGQVCALQVAMSLWGGGPHSRLFTEVREKRSLCYYASAGGDSDKGLVLVQSGCDAASVAAVGEQSLAQLAEIAGGRFSDTELATAIAVCQGPLKSLDDSPAARLSWTADQWLRGFDETPDQRIAELGRVGRDEVAAAASALWLDVDYALLPEAKA